MSVENIVGKPRPERESLKESVEELIIAVKTLVSVFEKAREEIKSEPTQQVLLKLDELTIYNKQLIQQNQEILEQTTKALAQNKEIARSIAMLLEVNREHLPEIAKHTRVTSEVRRVDNLGSPRSHPVREKSFDDESMPNSLDHP